MLPDNGIRIAGTIPYLRLARIDAQDFFRTN